MQTERPSPDDGFHVVPIHSDAEQHIHRNSDRQRELILQNSQTSPCCNRDLRNQPQANAVGAGKRNAISRVFIVFPSKVQLHVE